MTEQTEIPYEEDRATGVKGELGAWPEGIETRPLPVWDGDKAVLAYATMAHLGEHVEEGDVLAIVFNDRAVKVEVTEIEEGDD